jgi:hypothetical protein
MLVMLLFATTVACFGLALMCRIADRPLGEEYDDEQA